MGIYPRLTDCSKSLGARPIFGTHLHGVWALTIRIWVVGDEGTILHSRDGGQTWRRQVSGTTVPLQLIYGMVRTLDQARAEPSCTRTMTARPGVNRQRNRIGLIYGVSDCSHLYVVGARGTILRAATGVSIGNGKKGEHRKHCFYLQQRPAGLGCRRQRYRIALQRLGPKLATTNEWCKRLSACHLRRRRTLVGSGIRRHHSALV